MPRYSSRGQSIRWEIYAQICPKIAREIWKANRFLSGSIEAIQGCNASPRRGMWRRLLRASRQQRISNPPETYNTANSEMKEYYYVHWWCYVHSIMQGELIPAFAKGKVTVSTFKLHYGRLRPNKSSKGRLQSPTTFRMPFRECSMFSSGIGGSRRSKLSYARNPEYLAPKSSPDAARAPPPPCRT
jgi:hypothetical protein